ncbi:MAG TPA: hypothetical protein EYP07_15295 [Kiloniellaceae bacterium]|nr:hypothetical protein [Kiloniellaceae bacterium]
MVSRPAPPTRKSSPPPPSSESFSPPAIRISSAPVPVTVLPALASTVTSAKPLSCWPSLAS